MAERKLAQNQPERSERPNRAARNGRIRQVVGSITSAGSARDRRARRTGGTAGATAPAALQPSHRTVAGTSQQALSSRSERHAGHSARVGRSQRTVRSDRTSKRRIASSRPAMPPVMARSSLGSMAHPSHTAPRGKGYPAGRSSQPRRRFDIALDVPGAELRLPSLPLVHLGWRAFSALLVVAMLVCLAYLWKSPSFQVSMVEAEGLQRLTVGDLNSVLGIFGDSIFGINPSDMERDLQTAFPELASVSVQIALPARVFITVSERQPVVSWLQDGREVWVDAEGVTFPPRGDPGQTESGGLVRVEGHGALPGITTDVVPLTEDAPVSVMPPQFVPGVATWRLPPELVAAILTMSAQLPLDTILVYDAEHGLGWHDPNGWEAYFGAQTEDMTMKLAVYQALVQRLQSEGIQPALISVEYVHAPIYRMER